MRIICTVVILGVLGGLVAYPAQAATTSCVLSGTYVLISSLSFQGADGQLSGTFTFTPPPPSGCTPGTPGTADLNLSILFAGSATPLTFAGSFPYTVDSTGAVTIGQDLITGTVAAAEGTGLANALVFVAAPTLDPTIHLAGTAVRSALAGIQIGVEFAANVAVGFHALASNTTGAYNTAVGEGALRASMAADGNTAVGHAALVNATGGNNIAIGRSAGASLGTGSNNIIIGPNVATPAEADTIRIGGLQTRAFIGGIRGRTTGVADAIPVLIDSIGQLGTASSTRRVKDEIRDMEDASEGLLRLRPVTFRYTQHTASGSQRLQYGLVAEEVAEVIPELVVRDADGGPETVIYHQLPAMLLNELQKQHARIETLTSRMRALEQQLAEVLPKTGEARVE